MIMPVMNNKESPGKKKPTNKPVSANMINITIYRPPLEIMKFINLSGSANNVLSNSIISCIVQKLYLGENS
jgi:hypothetical protein